MQIAGLQKSSLLDYPSEIATVVFTPGCNFRCPYCHNPNLLKFNSLYKHEEYLALDFLKKRVGKISAVVVSGGEPTLQNGLVEFFIKLKNMGFLTKLDTNGTNPDVLEYLTEKNLVDYVAMDIKGPLHKYEQIARCKVDINKILSSINILKKSHVLYEFRTTVVKSLLKIDDFENIGQMIETAQIYYLQKFVKSNILDESFLFENTYSEQEFLQIKKILSKYVSNVFVR